VAEHEDRALPALEQLIRDREVHPHAVADLRLAERHQLEPLDRDVALVAVAALRDPLELLGRRVRERLAQVVEHDAAAQAQHAVHDPERRVR
jgi:hypothetical protein